MADDLAAVDRQDLQRLLESLEEDQRSILKQLLGLVDGQIRFRIQDVWESLELPTSHWVLLMSGVDQEEELEAATELLLWKEFTARGASQAVCIPASSRRLFRLFAKSFDISSLPTLLVSDSPEMSTAIRFDAILLADLIKKRGNLRRLLSEIHTSVEKGRSLREIASTLEKEKWFSLVKSAYAEVRSFMSVTIRSEI